MKTVLVGAGNLATNLAVALHGAGHEVVQVLSRTEESAQRLASMIGASPITNPSMLVSDADVYIISITDMSLQTFDFTVFPTDAFVVHTAGSMPMDVIRCRRRGVLYPMQTFSRQRIVDFKTIPIFVEASGEEDTQVLEEMARTLSGNVYRLSSADRLYLHVAAVFCSNFVNHCYALTDEILSQHNIPFEAMLPLLDEVAAKVHKVPPRDAQTGPAARHDLNVINKHLELLSDQPRLQQIYDIMSKSISND